MRWLLLLLALLAFAGLFQVNTPGMVALCIGGGLVALIASFFAFAAARVGSVAQGQDSRELDLLIAAKKAAPLKTGAPVQSPNPNRTP